MVEEQITEMDAPKYSVEVTNVSDVITEPHSVAYQATLNNISAEPYITNFAFSKCQFEDAGGNTFVGSLMTETSFKQAIMPGKSQSITVSDPASVYGYTNSGKGFEKCEYDASGIKLCSVLPELHVKSCIAYITTDGSQASNEWGRNPIEVTFLKNNK